MENEGDIGKLASAALGNLQSKYPEGDRIRLGTEYGMVDKILNKLVSDPSDDNMARLINVAGSGRPSSLSKITTTAEDLGYPLLNAAISKFGDDHQIFNTPKGRYAKTYRDRLATQSQSLEENLDPDKHYLMDGGAVYEGPFDSYEEAEAAMDVGGLQIKSPKPKFSKAQMDAADAAKKRFGL